VFVDGLLSGVPDMTEEYEYFECSEECETKIPCKLCQAIVNASTSLERIAACLEMENLKVIGDAITVFLDGILEKAGVTNGKEGKD